MRDRAVRAGVVLAVSAMALAGCASAEDVLRADSEHRTSGPNQSDDSPRGLGPGPSGAGLDRFYDQDVTWTDCSGGECADIWVPVDYAKPNGRALTLQAKRKLAEDPGNRQGSLLINPGGPGGSGIDMLSFFGFGSEVTDNFDIVGFDPRGVARSTPVHCIDDAEKDTFNASDPSPDSPAEIKEYEATVEEFVEGCEQGSPALLPYMSTVEVARDLDVLRAVLGDKQLNFYGASYGTAIGATYAGLFPKNVGRMVLDGAVDPTDDGGVGGLDQAKGFETALTAYLEDCVTDDDCPVGDDVDAGRQQIIDLMADIDADPLPTSSGRELTEGLAFTGLVLPLYDRTSWTLLTTALRGALDGDGSVFLYLADTYSGRQKDGSYGDNATDAQAAVNCLDSPSDDTIEEIEESGPKYAEAAPVFGPVAQWWPYLCSHWPVTSAAKKPDYSAPGAAPIVVVGTTRDPATPYDQAVRLADLLDSGVLLTRDGDGHTAYMSGNDCIRDAVDTYFVDGTPPPDDTTC